MSRVFTITFDWRKRDTTARRELDRVDAALGWKQKGGGRVKAVRELQRKAGLPVFEEIDDTAASPGGDMSDPADKEIS